MAEEIYEIFDPKNPKRKIKITVVDGQFPTDAEIDSMFKELYPEKVKPAESKPVAAQPKPSLPVVAPSSSAKPLPLPAFGTGGKTEPAFGIPTGSTLGTFGQLPATQRPSVPEQVLRKQPISELTAMTPKERAEFTGSMPAKERAQRSEQGSIQGYINKWLTGSRPESLAYQKFIDYANASGDVERAKALEGLSDLGKVAFKQRLSELERERDRSLAPLTSMVTPWLLETTMPGTTGRAAADVYRTINELGGGLPSTPLNVANAMLTGARSSATLLSNATVGNLLGRTEGMPGYLPLGFDPRGAMLPPIEAGSSITGGGMTLRRIAADMAQPESLALLAAGGPIARGAGAVLSRAPVALQRAAPYVMGAGFAAPIMKGAIEQGDPGVIATTAAVTLGPMAVMGGASKAISAIRGRALPRGSVGMAAFDALEASLAKPGEAVAKTAEGVVPTEPVVAPTATEPLVPTEAVVATEPVVAPLETPVAPVEPPAITPPVTGEVAPAAGEPGVAGPLTIRGQTQRLGEVEAVDQSLAELWGNGGEKRLSPAERRQNLNAWRARAAAAINTFEDIYASQIEPWIKDWDPSTPVPPGIDTGGDIRVAAAMKQAQLLARAMQEADPTLAQQYRREAFKLGKVVATAGSKAGLELAMTRHFRFGNIDWASDDVAVQVQQAIQGLGIDDDETLRMATAMAESIRKRLSDIHTAQDVKATAAAEAVARKTRTRRAPTEGPGSKISQVKKGGPTDDQFNEALDRIKTAFTAVGITPGSTQQTLPEDLIIVGWYLVNKTGRNFAAWSKQMRETLVGVDISDARLQEVWLNARFREQQSVKRKASDPAIFSEEISKMLGLENATKFFDGIRDPDGTPTILTKLITGEKLNATEQKLVNDVWSQVAPKRAATTPAEPGGAKTPIQVFKEGMAELRNLEQEIARQTKQSEKGTFATVKAQVDKRLAELGKPSTGKRGGAPLEPDAQLYKDRAGRLTAHIKALVKKYGAALDPEDLTRLVDKTVKDFQDSPDRVEAIKAEFTQAITDMSPAQTQREMFETALRRVGKDRAAYILQNLDESIIIKLSKGEPLTPEERRIVGRVYAEAPTPAKPPRVKTTAEEGVRQVTEAGAEERAAAKKAIRELEQEAKGDFRRALDAKFGLNRAQLISDAIADTGIESIINQGERLGPEYVDRLATAIYETSVKPKEPTPPNFAMQQILNAQAKAQATTDLERVSTGEGLTRPKIDTKSFLDVAVREYRDGARDLVNFRNRIKEKYPDLFTDDELNSMFTESAKRYEADVTSLENEKARIAALVAEKLRTNLTAWERFKGFLANYTNIYRFTALGQDLGILIAQGAFMKQVRPATVFSGLPKAVPYSERGGGTIEAAQRIAQFLLGGRVNLRSANVPSSMIQSLFSERKSGEFVGEIKALQNALYGSTSYYDDIGLVLEPLGHGGSLVHSGNISELYRGMEAVEATPLIGTVYKRVGAKKVFDAFQRATAIGLNRMRIAVFESLMEGYRGLPDDQRDVVAGVLAQMANLYTGKAHISPESRAAVSRLFGDVVTAPEFYAGTAQKALLFPPQVRLMKSISAAQASGVQLPKREQLKLAMTWGKELARFGVSIAAMKTMAEYAGFEVNTDYLSDDFLTARIPIGTGGYRKLDISGGLAPYISVMLQFINGAETDISSERPNMPPKLRARERGSILYDWVKGKLTVLPQTGLTIFAPKSWVTDVSKRPTYAEREKGYFAGERRTVGGKSFELVKDGNFNTASLMTIGQQFVPMSILARNFLNATLDYRASGLSAEEQRRALIDLSVGEFSNFFGVPISSPRISPQNRRAFDKFSSGKARTSEEIRARELQVLYGNKR